MQETVLSMFFFFFLKVGKMNVDLLLKKCSVLNTVINDQWGKFRPYLKIQDDRYSNEKKAPCLRILAWTGLSFNEIRSYSSGETQPEIALQASCSAVELAIVSLQAFFVKVENVFNDKLPTTEWFCLAKSLAKFGLLKESTKQQQLCNHG